ncbi:head-tail connector protein [Gemmata sp. JC673]|uniref:Head-tail connector protein n=1 Tax=Gemmata algarum TaxID=2975278 RepID=A0ABU5EWW4_9BACT|nr:head-tail connector protein [Gemmata algarum]MDY3558119.1 head-tail connector protein [Gemmata algarum]
MYGLTIVTPAAAPVTAAELRDRLRINGTAEDGDLTEFLASAVERFEDDTGRPVLTTGYRQDLAQWPAGGLIVLGRGGVTAVTAVKRYLADGSTETLAADQWRADLLTPPARVQLAAVPARVTTAAGIAVSPVGCVEFTAGWANAAAVPKQVLTALKLLAGHWYENREAHTEKKLAELPDGWARVVSRYKLGLSGSWGQ